MRDKVLGEFEERILLSILREGAGAYSLEVRRRIEEETGKKVSRGAFYTALERLRGKGLVRWKESQPENARREGTQRLFAVTRRGLEALDETCRVLKSRWAELDRALEKL